MRMWNEYTSCWLGTTGRSVNTEMNFRVQSDSLQWAESILRSWQFLSYSRNPPHFMESEDSSPHSQQLTICAYPEPDQSSPCPPPPTSRRHILIFRPDRPWDPPPSLLYNGYRVSFPGVKRPGNGVNHPPTSGAEVKERVKLYLYSPSGHS
jgi:hypothetical protein